MIVSNLRNLKGRTACRTCAAQRRSHLNRNGAPEASKDLRVSELWTYYRNVEKELATADAAVSSAVVRTGVTWNRTGTLPVPFALLLPLYHPLAVRVADNHVLGKSERKIRVQTLDSSVSTNRSSEGTCVSASSFGGVPPSGEAR